MRFLLAALFLAFPALATVENEVHQVLDQQVEAWNRGDLQAFAATYENSESLTFVSRKGVHTGHAAMLASYLRNYPTRASMGALHFSGLQIQPLCSGYASVIGHFHLDRTPQAGGPSEGIFTLLLRKTDAGWKIILDHTS